jgi:hypothetical protein
MNLIKRELEKQIQSLFKENEVILIMGTGESVKRYWPKQSERTIRVKACC